MHAKTDSAQSELTSIEYATTTPPRSPRRPLYYVQSPSQHDYADKMSYGTSSPVGSPSHGHNGHLYHYQYHCSPIHHSRESSTSRFSASLKGGGHHSRSGALSWKKLNAGKRLGDDGDEEEEEEEEEDGDEMGRWRREGHPLRIYGACFVVSFVVLFALFSLILWGASKSYKPHVLVKRMVFIDFNVQAGMDSSGVPTDMLSLNSSVRLLYNNPATFFGVHVTSTPFELHYYQLKVASGQMKPFYQRRQTERNSTTVVRGVQVPLYGAVAALGDARAGDQIQKESVRVGLNLTFTMRSRAYILGRLVKSKFYRHVRCPVTLDGSRLGKPLILKDSCTYR